MGQGSERRGWAGWEAAGRGALAGGGLLRDRGVQFGWRYVGEPAAMGGCTFLPAPPERCWQEAESLLRLVPGEKEVLGSCTGDEGRILPPSHVLKHPCGP